MIHQLRKILAVLAIVSILATPATLNVGAIATTEVGVTQYTNRYYVIQNVYSGKFLEVANGNLVQGTNVWQDTFNFDSNLSQVFAVYAADPADLPNNDDSNTTYFRLSPALNQNLCVDVYSAGDVDGANIHVFAENSGYGAQSFAFEQRSDGSFYIRPYLSDNRVLSVANNSNENQANVELKTKSSNSSQRWVFKEIHPTKDPDLISLNWSYFFRGDYSLPNRIISQRMHLDGSNTDNWHIGTDFIADEGVPIYSPCAGIVIGRGTNHSSMGNYVFIQTTAKIQTTNGLKPLTIRLMHMSQAPNVTNNQAVTVNTALGYVGNTGDSKGAHLHVDINTGGLTSGDAIRSNPHLIVNVEKLFLSKRFRYGGRSSNIYATDVVY